MDEEESMFERWRQSRICTGQTFHNGSIKLLPFVFPSLKCNACEEEMPLEKLQRCSRCMKVYYCNKECQRNDWLIHKEKCIAIK